MPTEVQDRPAPRTRRGRARRYGTDAPGEHDQRDSAVRTILLDGDRVDHLEELPEHPERTKGSKPLWIDIDREHGETEDVADAFELDVLIARTGHRTNSIMKILTLTSVILLPGALIAGVMGMNFRVGLFDATWLFDVVLF